MIKHWLLASTILAGALALSLPTSAVTLGGAAPKFQPAISDSASDSILLIQVKGNKGSKGATGKKGKGAGGTDDGHDQGDDNDDQGDDDQGGDDDSQ